MSDCDTWRSTDAPADWENSWGQEMNPGAVMKCEELLDTEDSRGGSEVRSRLTCVDITNGQTGVTDGQSAGCLPCKDTAADHSSTMTKYRRFGSRLGGVKVRHKRQALQDMARPLKHWLYKHRDNPYPTKTEKVLLALGSHMTLVQVSNWFANARRRLKNTVRQPDLSWALRIKLYNKYIQGNAERLSVSSDGSNSDDEGCPLQVPVSQSEFNRSLPGAAQKQGGGLNRADSAHSDDSASTPSKYKSSLLNRYLNDTLRHVMAATSAASPSSAGDMAVNRKRRSHSQSFSSNECDDDDAVSPASSPSSETEANFVYRMDTVNYTSAEHDTCRPLDRGLQCRQDQEWREIHAAMALTNLAQGQSHGTEQSCTRGPNAAGQTTCTRVPTAITRATVVGKICAAGPTVGPFITGPAITSRIIQKSSHISEIKTVKVALINSV